MGRTDFVPVADRLDSHPDREVAAAALRARTAVQPVRELLLRRLDETCTQVSVTALVALMSRGWIELDSANERLEKLMERKSWQTAAELARAIRTVGLERGADLATQERFDSILIELDQLASTYRDVSCMPGEEPPAEPRSSSVGGERPDVRIRLEVARAMEVRRSPHFVPALVGMLRRQELRGAARAALVAIPGALGALDQAMAAGNLPRDILVHLPRTICMFEPEAAAAILMRHLNGAQDGLVRFKLIRGLVKLRKDNPDIVLDPTPLMNVATDTLEHAERLRMWGKALASGDERAPVSLRAGANLLHAAHHLLVDLVRDKETHALQRVFLLLELLEGDAFDDIWRGLRGHDPTAHASSLELLENLLKAPLRDRILGLVGEVAEGEEGAVAPPSYADAIREILAEGSSTMRTLAEYRALELGIDPSTVPRAASARTSTLADSLGGRFMSSARDLLVPESSVEGRTRAPA
jgi:hypothetical protein